jgi:Na+/H+-dicarboxylate symporter
MIQALWGLSLWQRVFLGLIGGIVTGFFLGESAQVLKPFGDVFIRLIKMIIIPLIFLSIINGMGHIKDSKQLGRVGVKAVVAYVLCTSFAIFIGFVAAWVFEPGKGMVLAKTVTMSGHPEKAFNLLEMVLNIVPDNALGAMAQGSILQAFFFSFFTGVTLIIMGPRAKRILAMTRDLTDLILTMVHMIVKLAPIAAFCLMAWCVGTQGTQILVSLSKLIGAGVFAFFLQYLVFGGMILIFGRLSPLPFYRKSIEYQTMAFATSSTKASLPMTMSVCRDKLGVSKLSSSFILPLGATINMDGLAIYLGLCAITFAQAAGKVLTLGDYGTIMLTTTLGSMGGAGIPSAAIIMLPMILTSVQLPLEGVALIAGIDRIMDTLRTTISITGDAAVTVVVDSSEGMIDKDMYNS